MPEPPVWDIPDEGTTPMEVAGGSTQPSVPAVAPTAAEQVALEKTPLGDAWHDVVMQLIEAEAITALVRELALQSQLIARDTQAWTLRVERSSLNQSVPRERLAKALAEAAGCPALVVESGKVTDTPALRNKAVAQARQVQAQAIVDNDPQVQHLVQTLGATIVPGSIRRL